MNCLLKLKRILAVTVIISFLATGIPVPPSLAYAQTVEPLSQFQGFEIPAAFGKVTDILRQPAADARLLIHIQEAHANYDAQKNIKNILEHLSRNYGVRLVLLEGAGNKLNSGLFRFFPGEPELQQAVNEKLMQAGELTGAETFMIDDGDARKAEAWGVEEASSYAKNREAFKQVFEGHKLAESFLETFYRQWQKFASLFLSKPLKEFLTRQTAFEEGQLPLADWMTFLKSEAIRNLKLDLENVREQKDWPVLVRYFRLKTVDPRIDAVKVETEKKAFLGEVRKTAKGWKMQDGEKTGVFQDVEAIFESASKRDLPLYKTRFVFERLLDRLPKDFSFGAYPNLRLYLQQIILLSELQGEALQEEIRSLSKKLTASLIRTEKDRQFVGILQDFRLIKKLFQLELNRSEYQTLFSKKITIEKLLRELQAQDPKAEDLKRNPSVRLLSLKTLYKAAIRFYEGAIGREEGMMKRAFSRMEMNGQTKAVLITGGFHTEGLKEKAIRAGSSYIEITPRIGEITADSRKHYLTALLGKKTIEASQIAAAVRSDMPFFKVSPDWRRELAEVGADLFDILRQVTSPKTAQEKLRRFLETAVGVPAFQPAVVRAEMKKNAGGLRRSEVREAGPFYGSLTRRMDKKNRIPLPVEFGDLLPKGTRRLFAEPERVQSESGETQKGLRVYDEGTWRKIVEKNLPADLTQEKTYRELARRRIVELNVDSSGRILLSSAFKRGCLDDFDAEFVFSGAGDSFLITTRPLTGVRVQPEDRPRLFEARKQEIFNESFSRRLDSADRVRLPSKFQKKLGENPILIAEPVAFRAKSGEVRKDLWVFEEQTWLKSIKKTFPEDKDEAKKYKDRAYSRVLKLELDSSERVSLSGAFRRGYLDRSTQYFFFGAGDSFLITAARSEMRVSSGEEGLEAYTVVSRQLEAGLDRSILEALNKELSHRFQGMGSMIRRYVGLVAELTLTGGLGALMHDLFPSWAQNLGDQHKGLKDLIAINVIYDRIKGQQYAKSLPDAVLRGKETLGDYLRSVLKIDKSLELSFELESGEDFRRKAAEERAWAEQYGSQGYKETAWKTENIIGKTIRVDVYPTKTHFNQAPNYYLDAYFYDNEGKKIRVFDEVYPDSSHGRTNLWRDVHMAVYGRASQHLVQKLQQKGVVKDKILFVDNEVFVSTPTPMFPEAIHHHINHTVFRPGLYMPDEASYEMLEYPETQRKYITKNGKIDVVNAVGISSRLITGVALYEHSNVLAEDILAPFINKLETFNENGVRNTNGVLLEQWQSPILRNLIDQYKQQVDLRPEVSDKEFFEILSSPSQVTALEAFKQKAEFAKAVHVAELLLWMKEDQNFSSWFDKMATDYKQKAGLDVIDDQRLVEDFRRAVEAAIEEPAAWQALLQNENFVFLKDLLLKDPILSNVRRQVPYKGPDKWIEILEGLKNDPEALAEFKAKGPRLIIGGREFGDDAHWMFLRIQSLVGEMGLQDRIVTIEDYNIYIAPIIFGGISGAVMLSDEKLEASATSMMKAMTNMAALIGVWGGADPELFTIVDTKTGRELDVFKDKVTHDQLVAKLGNGEWKITNGFLIAYSQNEYSVQDGGGRRPSAESLLQSLYDLSGRYQDPSRRRDLQFAVLQSTPKVDMARGQAVAHKALWERTLRTLQKEDRFFDELDISADDAKQFFKKSLAQEGQPEFFWHGTTQDARNIPGILGFIEGFRYLRMKGRESYNSVAYHAMQGEKGDIFNYLGEFFEGFDETFIPVVDTFNELLAQARAANTVQEKVHANLEALEILERLAVEISVHLLKHYIRTGDKEAEIYLASPVVRENISIYLEQHAVPFKSIAKKIRGYAVDIDGQKYVVALNLGEFIFRGAGAEKARSSFYGREALEYLARGRDGARNYWLMDAISGVKYDKYSFKKMAETIPIGVPPLGVQILKLEDSPVGDEKRQVPLDESLSGYLEALTRGRLIRVSDDQVITKLLRQKIETLKDFQEAEQLTRLSPKEAVEKFGEEGVPPVMAFIAVLFPDKLEEIKGWNSKVYVALDSVFQQTGFRNLFKKGVLRFHDTSRDSAIVLSRSLDGKNVVIPIHFPGEPKDEKDGKVWFNVLKDVERLGIENSGEAQYQVRNLLIDKLYPLEHSGKEFCEGKWSVGVPVQEPPKPGISIKPLYRFQVLEIIPAHSRESIERQAIAIRSMNHSEELLDFIGPATDAGSNLLLLMYSYEGRKDAKDLNKKLKDILEELFYSKNVTNNDRGLTGDFSEVTIDSWEEMLTKVKEQMERVKELGDGSNLEETKFLQGALEKMNIAIVRIQSRSEIINREVPQTPVSLNEVLDLLPEQDKKKNSIRRIVEVRGDKKDLAAKFMGNPLSVASVFQNLIVNGRKAWEEKTGDKDIAPKIVITLSRESGRDGKEFLVVEVADNGKGISEKQLGEGLNGKKIFDLNETDRPDDSGTGLGTTEAWYVIRDMGGTIDADNVRDDKGSLLGAEFTIRLPVLSKVQSTEKRSEVREETGKSRPAGSEIVPEQIHGGEHTEHVKIAMRSMDHSEELLDFFGPATKAGDCLQLVKLLYEKRQAVIQEAAGNFEGKDEKLKSLGEIFENLFGPEDAVKNSGGLVGVFGDGTAAGVWEETLSKVKEQMERIKALSDGSDPEEERLLQESIRQMDIAIVRLQSRIEIVKGEALQTPINLKEVLDLLPERDKKKNGIKAIVEVHGKEYLETRFAGNPLSVASMFYNLIVNGRKAWERKTGDKDIAPRIVITLSRELGREGKEFLVVEVEDNRKELSGEQWTDDPESGTRRQRTFGLNNSTRAGEEGNILGAKFTIRFPIVESVSRRSEMRTEKVWPQHEAQKIAVIGAGFVGATKAILLVTDWGHDVIAVDVQPQIVEKLSNGTLTFHADDLQELLTEGLATGKLKFTTDYKEAVEGREIIFLAVQTPQSETGHANITYLKDSVREIAKLIHPGESKIIIGKSTAPPRDTVAALKAVVAEVFQQREAAGEDLQNAVIHFAWEPEFLREGKEVEDDRGVAGRVVIGADDSAIAEKIKALYAYANPDPQHARTNVPIVLTDLTSAPLVKYAANGYRGMKISFINFISWLTEALGLNIDQVAHDIATQKNSTEEDRRIGRAFLSAGLGFGGSCFPKDLAAAVQIARGLGVLPGLVLDALAVNEVQWKRFVEKRVISQLQNVQGKTIVVLGASFKPGTDDIRESRASKVIARLLGRGAKIRVYDPVAVERLRDPRIGPFKDDTEIEYYSNPAQLNAMLENADAVILATEWPEFNQIDFGNLRNWFVDHHKKLPPVFDGRNFFDERKVNDPELIQRLKRNLPEREEESLKFPYFNIGHGETHGVPLVPQEEFTERVRESFLALRVSYINMIAEIAERVGANIRDVKRGLGLDFVVGEEYLMPGIGWGGNKLSSAIEALEGYVLQYLSEQLLQEFRKTRQDIQQKFEFPPDAVQTETLPVPFMTTVRKINDQQIALYLEKAKKAAGGDLRGKVVAVLGLAYKPGEFATYKSRALNLIEALLKEGAIVRATDVDQQAVTNVRRDLEDMHVSHPENLTLILGAPSAQENAREAVRGSEIQILVTASSAFANLEPIFFGGDRQPVTRRSRLVDGRHFYNPADLEKLGIEYFAVGVPSRDRLEELERAQSLAVLHGGISFSEKSIRVQSQEDGSFLVSLKVRVKSGMLGKIKLFSSFGFYKEEQSPWQDQEVDVKKEITLLSEEGEWGEYEIRMMIDPKKYFPGRTGTLGVTFFALTVPVTAQEARFFNWRFYAGDQSVRDGEINMEGARSEVRAVAPVVPATLDAFLELNKSFGGGELQGFRGVTEKITDGIWSFTAHTLDGVKLVASFFGMATAQAGEAFDIASAPATADEKRRFTDARKVLLGSKVLGDSDVLILAPEFGVDLGAALLMRKIVGDAPVAVLVRSDADRKFLGQINLKLRQAHRPVIFPAATLPEASQFLGKSVRGKMNIKPMVYSGEKNVQADLLLQQYGNAVITVTPGMFKNFLSLAGVSGVLTRLRDEYLATARSA